MLLTIELAATTGPNADTRALSHLLRKHPDKVQDFELPVGNAHVFYPELSEERTTAALLVEIDPVALVRSKRFRGDHGLLNYYVNDRPYTASSLLSVAIGRVFRSAMSPVSESHPELAGMKLPLTLRIPVVATRGVAGTELSRRLFEPLGWEVSEQPLALDPNYPQWGSSPYSQLTLCGQVRLDQALRQLYILLPVLDNSKHYWVSEDEVDKLTRHGTGWLETHPERDLITQRYLIHQKSLVELSEKALDALLPEVEEKPISKGAEERTSEPPLRVQRATEVLRALSDYGVQRVADVGCGPGALLRRLFEDRSFTQIIGTDVSVRALEQAARALNLDELSDTERQRIQLLHGSVMYRDERLQGVEGIVLMEVIEHIDQSRLGALEDSIFGAVAPRVVVVTTPNSEFNVHYPTLAAGSMRHTDHRFEWTREELRAWAQPVAERYGYQLEYRGVGGESAKHGFATQMVIFSKERS